MSRNDTSFDLDAMVASMALQLTSDIIDIFNCEDCPHNTHLSFETDHVLRRAPHHSCYNTPSFNRLYRVIKNSIFRIIQENPNWQFPSFAHSSVSVSMNPSLHTHADCPTTNVPIYTHPLHIPMHTSLQSPIQSPLHPPIQPPLRPPIPPSLHRPFHPHLHSNIHPPVNNAHLRPPMFMLPVLEQQDPLLTGFVPNITPTNNNTNYYPDLLSYRDDEIFDTDDTNGDEDSVESVHGSPLHVESPVADTGPIDLDRMPSSSSGNRKRTMASHDERQPMIKWRRQTTAGAEPPVDNSAPSTSGSRPNVFRETPAPNMNYNRSTIMNNAHLYGLNMQWDDNNNDY